MLQLRLLFSPSVSLNLFPFEGCYFLQQENRVMASHCGSIWQTVTAEERTCLDLSVRASLRQKLYVTSESELIKHEEKQTTTKYRLKDHKVMWKLKKVWANLTVEVHSQSVGTVMFHDGHGLLQWMAHIHGYRIGYAARTYAVATSSVQHKTINCPLSRETCWLVLPRNLHIHPHMPSLLIYLIPNTVQLNHLKRKQDYFWGES